MTTFDEFWAVYPPRKGSRAKVMANRRFDAAVKNGADPDQIVHGARHYAEEMREAGNLNTPFVCMAATWLHQERWMDYVVSPGEAKALEELQAKMAQKGWRWTGEKWEKSEDVTTH